MFAVLYLKLEKKWQLKTDNLNVILKNKCIQTLQNACNKFANLLLVRHNIIFLY